MTYARAEEVRKVLYEFMMHCNESRCNDCPCVGWCRHGDAFLTDNPAGWEIWKEDDSRYDEN